MRRYFILASIVALGVGALLYSRRHAAETSVGPNAILKAVADVQRETSRIPMRVTRLSDAQEIEIGNAIATQYVGNLQAQYTYSAADMAFQQLVQKIGSALAARARRQLPYRFYYIPDSSFFNAFALPGGHVVLGKGLAINMTTEDQLAAVLAHEIEHVDQFHCAERVQLEAQLKHIPLGSLVNLPITLFQAGYSKEQELEADRQGTLLMIKSGYAPIGAVRLFQVLEKMHGEYVRKASTPPSEMTRVAWQTIVGYFRSHPEPSERIREIQALIEREPAWGSKLETPLAIKP
jgi:beta-barrel assembly-enhancing protease